MKKIKYNGAIPPGQRLAGFLTFLIWSLYIIIIFKGNLSWNSQYLIRQITTMGFFVFGIGLEMSLGDIDLCFMAQSSVGTLILTILVQNKIPFFYAVLIMMIAQCCIGIFRSLITAKLNIPMIISSFAMNQILSNIYSQEDTILLDSSSYKGMSIKWTALLLLIGCTVGAYLFWKNTYWGKYSIAIGENRMETIRSGVEIIPVIIIVYLFASILFSFGTVMIFIAAPYGSSNRNADYLYLCITAAFLAGGLNNNWSYKAFQLLIATISCVMLRQILTIFEMSNYMMIAEGVIILLISFAQSKYRFI